MGGVAHFKRSQVFVVLFCFWGLFSIAWATRLCISRQKLEVQKHLKRLNKPAVQSIQGDSGMKGSFATCVSGLADLYQVNKRKPYHSVNFVVTHDGFTLYDLISYNFKHNEANGEGGNDGSNDNLSFEGLPVVERRDH